MISAVKIFSAAAAMLGIILCAPAFAADPVFPTNSRVGLVPPGDMVVSKTFQGFGDPLRDSAILVTALPPEAYDGLDKTGVPDALRKQGLQVDKREPITLGIGKGFLVTGTETTDKVHYRKWILVVAASANNLTVLVSVQVPEHDTTYSDKVVRAALASLAVRDTIPDQERLSVMPFTIGDLAGFRVKDVLPGRALMLYDPRGEGDAGSDAIALNAHLMIAALPGGPNEPVDWANFAREAFDAIGGLKDVHVQVAEPLRIGGQPGFQIVAKAKDAKTDKDIVVVQWLRFGTGGYLQMIGSARADGWNDEFTRLRAIRDSIEPK